MASSSAMPPLLPKVDAILVLDGDGNRLAGKYYGDFMRATASSASDPSPSSSGGGGSAPPAQQGGGTEQMRANFERMLQSKIGIASARPDAAEVVTVLGRTCVFVGGRSSSSSGGGASSSADKSRGGVSSPPVSTGDVRVVHVGPPGESELLLAYLCEGMYEALSHLMGGNTDRNMVLDNLELVFLLIDEHCDGGIILETDGHKLANSVLLRDGTDGRMDPTTTNGGGMMAGGGGGGGGGGGQAPPSGGGFSMAGLGGDMTIAQALMQARNQIISNLSQS